MGFWSALTIILCGFYMFFVFGMINVDRDKQNEKQKRANDLSSAWCIFLFLFLIAVLVFLD